MVDTSGTLLTTIRQLAAELHTRPAETIQVTLDSSLERDLGFDSLGRVELLTRLEQVFEISLPERVLATAEAGAPVVPVSIRGTRSILRDGHWFPRRGIITVTIGKPIAPEGKGWAAAIRLRNAARAEISRRCGEPDLAPWAAEEQAE